MTLKLMFYTIVLVLAFFGYRHYAMAGRVLQVGDEAPSFTLNDAKGQTHYLTDYAGKYLVLYFYPKDDTPGCTKEACHFRDDMSQFEQLSAKVVGVSVDNSASHADFAKKYHLPFPLLIDTNGAVAESYHSLTNFYFIKIAKRHTFLIDPNGKIARVYTSVDTSNHSQQIIDDLKLLQQKI
ncbi:MAG: peroxiredoxin [Methylotenera sp.]|uniref:peroxiredoxin n=1 Tax=Methylotenera sp. TaxID=2051956 RepID=UPI00248A0360|nr:peroxiredoxin [Methylotenera sp.]MDI1309977.1 peroxiredoxin [Methylotenera sp.]